MKFNNVRVLKMLKSSLYVACKVPFEQHMPVVIKEICLVGLWGQFCVVKNYESTLLLTVLSSLNQAVDLLPWQQLSVDGLKEV